MGDNGQPEVRDEHTAKVGYTDRLILDFNRGTFQLAVSGEVGGEDMALAMLQQAVRYFEFQLRIRAAGQVAQAAQDVARTQAVLDRIRKGS